MTTVHADVPPLLARADALEAEGRRREAIDVLSEANRRHRDAEVERRLVRLRHDAFAEIEPSQGSSTWPPEVPGDGVPSEPGPLRVAPDELTLEMLRHGILRYGSVHVPGAISPARVTGLIEGIDRAFDGYDAHATGTPASETTPWFEPFKPTGGRSLGIRRKWTRDGSGIWAPDSPRMLFELLETLEQVGLARLITTYLGERPAFSMNKCVLRKVSLDTVGDWHQDGAFLGDDIRALNVWITLSDCGRDAPGLDVVGRRLDRVVETGTEGSHFDWSVGQPVVDRVAEGTVVRPEFEAGDVLLFDELMLHRTALDPSMTHERHAIESWFFAPSYYPDDQVPLAY